MKRHWIEFTEDWTPGPMTVWVHIPSKSDPAVFSPPPPLWIPGKGFPVYFVEVDGFTFPLPSRHRGDRIQPHCPALAPNSSHVLEHSVVYGRRCVAQPCPHRSGSCRYRPRPHHQRPRSSLSHPVAAGGQHGLALAVSSSR